MILKIFMLIMLRLIFVTLLKIMLFLQAREKKKQEIVKSGYALPSCLWMTQWRAKLHGQTTQCTHSSDLFV